MAQLPEPLQRLIEELARLPAVGPKTAQRLAFHILKADETRAHALAVAIEDVRAKIVRCRRCYNFAEGSLCPYCQSSHRDPSVICVVESALDVLAIERTSEYRGLYFVLGGNLSPIDGVGPGELHLTELEQRVREEGIEEVIVATNADIEGEATAVYIQRLLGPSGARVTRPAHGLPVGGDLEYADERTLARALIGRGGF